MSLRDLPSLLFGAVRPQLGRGADVACNALFWDGTGNPVRRGRRKRDGVTEVTLPA